MSEQEKRDAAKKRATNRMIRALNQNRFSVLNFEEFYNLDVAAPLVEISFSSFHPLISVVFGVQLKALTNNQSLTAVKLAVSNWLNLLETCFDTLIHKTSITTWDVETHLATKLPLDVISPTVQSLALNFATLTLVETTVFERLVELRLDQKTPHEFHFRDATATVVSLPNLRRLFLYTRGSANDHVPASFWKWIDQLMPQLEAIVFHGLDSNRVLATLEKFAALSENCGRLRQLSWFFEWNSTEAAKTYAQALEHVLPFMSGLEALELIETGQHSDSDQYREVIALDQLPPSVTHWGVNFFFILFSFF